MILQALYEYYQRKVTDPDSQIAPTGFEWKKISFLVVIDKNGNFVRFEDTQEDKNGRLIAKEFLLPRGSNRQGPKAYEISNILWDHYGYILGLAKDDSEKAIKMAQKQKDAFKEKLKKLPIELKKEPEINAVIQFYESAEGLGKALQDSRIFDIRRIAGCNLTFHVEGTVGIVTDLDTFKSYVPRISEKVLSKEQEDEVAIVTGVCSITGSHDTICRKHNKVAINNDSDSLISFQKNSGYDSYGKKQAYNASIGEKAEFAYVEALKNLLRNDSDNKMLVGDAITVFWSEKNRSGFEQRIKSFFLPPAYSKDDPDKGIRECQSALEWLRTGIPPEERGTRFYILGLSPGGGSRIAIRFWHQGTVAKFAQNISEHFDSLEITHPQFDNTWLGLKVLLRSIALKEEVDKLAPNLSGNMARAILSGSPYPETFQQQCLRRIRAEHFDSSSPSKYDRNGRLRAAILKACLNRRLRIRNPEEEKEVTVALDPENTNVGYRLGRLFAELEKIQEDASGGNLNSTIRDRFYGAASASPVSAFPQLLKLKNHHLSKIENPRFRMNHEKRLAEIIGGLPTNMPSHLSMDDQARFAIGYYHQRQAFYISNKDLNPKEKGEQINE